MKFTHHDNRGFRSVSHEDSENLIAVRGYKAIVSDCDGTLVERAEAHFNSFQVAAKAQGANLEKIWYEQRTGMDRYSRNGTAVVIEIPRDALFSILA